MTKKNTILSLAAVSVVIIAGALILTERKSLKEIRFDNEIKQIETQSSSDEIEAIENDLENTDFSDLDRELQDIELELNQAY